MVIYYLNRTTTSDKMKFNYLTEEEANMPLDMALLQLTLGLQSCKTKHDVIELLEDAVELGRRQS